MGMIKKTVSGDTNTLRGYVKSAAEENKIQSVAAGGTAYGGNGANGRSAGSPGGGVNPYSMLMASGDYRIAASGVIKAGGNGLNLYEGGIEENSNTTGGKGMTTPTKVYNIPKGKSKF